MFRAANGERLVTEGNARLYTIPENGILLTQADLNVGMSPVWKFFSVGQDGERVPIVRILTSTVPDTPENRANPAHEIFYPRRGQLRPGASAAMSISNCISLAQERSC